MIPQSSVDLCQSQTNTKINTNQTNADDNEIIIADAYPNIIMNKHWTNHNESTNEGPFDNL